MTVWEKGSKNSICRRITCVEVVLLRISTTLMSNFRQVQVPRYTYLPLLLPEIEQVFLPTVIPSEDLASSHSESETKGYRREDYWFEVEWDGKRGKQREVCKW